MEIRAPYLHSNKYSFTHTPPYKKYMPSTTPIPFPTHLPLHRPDYKPPRPVKLKPPPKQSIPKTTTSDILRLMDSLKLPIPIDTYVSLIKECTELRDPLKAIELHKHMRNSGVRLNLPLFNRILLLYVSCGCFEHARNLFDQMSLRNFNSWAVVIAGCVENGEYDEAVNLFVDMICHEKIENLGDHHIEFLVSGILVCLLKACLYTMDLDMGMQLHGWLWKMGYSRNVALRSFLINFYGKMKCLDGARTVFEQAHCRNTVVWTSRIVNCCDDDNFEGAISVLKEMGRQGVRKNGYTFSSALKSCIKLGDIECGRQIHATTMKVGLELDGFVHCALVDLYGKCGSLKDATSAFDFGHGKRDDACWNAILCNYVRHGLCVEATEILHEMKLLGFEPKESLCNEVNLMCHSIGEEL